MRLLLSLIYFLSFSICAENIWLDKSWNVVSSAPQATYFMTSPLKKSGSRWTGAIYYVTTHQPRFKGGFDRATIGEQALPIGHYEDFYANGEVKQVGQRNLYGELVGKNTYYDAQGHRTEDRFYQRGVQQGVQREYYPSGHIKREYEMVDGELTNQAVDFYQNGARKVVALYRSGQRNGAIREFYADGKLRRDVTYVNGDIQGKETYYHQNGTKASEVNYLNGKKEGIYYQWSPDGIVIVEQTYVNNLVDGESRRYNRKGKLLSVRHYQAGNRTGENIEYNPETDQVKLREVYDAHQRLLIREKYSKTGIIETRFKVSYRQGLLSSDRKQYQHGILVGRTRVNVGTHWHLTEKFNLQGALLQRSEYRDGQREGEFRQTVFDAVNPERVLYVKTAYYRHGRLNGTYQSISADGRWYEKGQYWNDIKIGTWTKLANNGTQTEHYDRHGRLTGIQQIKSEQGQVLLLAHYQQGKLHGQYEAYNAEHHLMAKGHYVHGIKQGKWLEYGEDNQLWSGTYVNGNRVAEWVALSPQGYLLAKGQYDSRGRKYGSFYYFDDAGLLTRKMHFQQGIKCGKEIRYQLDKAQTIRHFTGGKLTSIERY